MATLTLDIPDVVAKRLQNRAEADGLRADQLAVDYIVGMLRDEGDDWFRDFIDAGRTSPSTPVTADQFEQRRVALRQR